LKGFDIRIIHRKNAGILASFLIGTQSQLLEGKRHPQDIVVPYDPEFEKWY
jgi:hypothetical protein